MAVSLGSGFVLLVTSLVHAGLPAILGLLGFDSLAAACRRMGGHLFGGGSWFGLLALVSAMGILIGAVYAVVDLVRVNGRLREAAMSIPAMRLEGFDVFEVPLSSPTALAVPHRHGPAVLFAGSLTDLLRPAEMNVVLRHEIAHLRHRHIRFQIIVQAVVGGLWFVPGIHRCTAPLRSSLERWADQEAAGGRHDGWKAIASAASKLSPIDDRPERCTEDGKWQAPEPLPGGWQAVLTGVMPLVLAMFATLGSHVLALARSAGA